MRARTALLALLLPLLSAAPAQALGQVRLFGYDQKREAIVVYMYRPAKWRVMTLGDRPRFVVDLPSSVYKGLTSQLPAIPGTGVSGVRIGQFTPDTVRIVLDLADPENINSYPVAQEPTAKGTYRLSIWPKSPPPSTQAASSSAAIARDVSTKPKKADKRPDGAAHIEDAALHGNEVMFQTTGKLVGTMRQTGTRATVAFPKAVLSASLRGRVLHGKKLVRSLSFAQDPDGVRAIFELSKPDADLEFTSERGQWRVSASRESTDGDSGIVLKRMGKGWQIALTSDEAVSYSVGKLSGGDRMYLDVYGGGFNLPRDSVYVDNGIIARVRVGQQDSKTTRLVMDFDQPIKSSVRLSSDRHTILLGINPGEEQERVTVDPGHGGRDQGAHGRYLKEKEVNLQVALRVQRLMEQSGINVQMTRSKDVEVMLHPRVDMGDANGSDVYVSIHANSFTNPGVRGIETYYYNPTSLPLAEAVHKQLVKTLNRPDRGVHRNNFVVVKYNKMPACLVEIGYLSNTEDEALLGNKDYQEKAARAITAGVNEFLHKRRTKL